MKKITFPKTLKLSVILSSFSIFTLSLLSAQNINTVGGIGLGAYDGDGGPAAAAEIYNPSGVFVDATGNLFFADQSNNRIREINASGIISTIAGNGVQSFSGDGGLATAAEIAAPQGIFADKSGNVFFTDFFNNRVRKVNTSGIITTLAGLSTNSYSGDGGPASVAELNAPSGVVTDTIGNIYIADEANNRIRIIDTAGIINTFAGNGVGSYSGDGGQATAAEIDNITGVAIDAAQNIYIADLGNRIIRKVSTSGIISTIAGIPGTPGFYGDGGPATAAELSTEVTGVCLDGFGNIYIGDYYRVRMVNTSGVITTVAGNGIASYSGDGGPATAAEINYAFSVTADVNGDFWLGDVFNNRIRKVTSVTSGIFYQSQANNQISIYPNPNNGQFTIQLSGIQGKPSLEVYNATGEKLITKEITSLNTPLDLSNQPTGIYLYRVVSETGMVLGSGKLIIK